MKTNRKIRLSLLVVMFMGWLSLSATIEYDGSEGLIFQKLADGTMSVSAGYQMNTSDLVIPAVVYDVYWVDGVQHRDPYVVTTIARQGFEAKYVLKTVTLPATITAIEDDAFHICGNMKSINIPSSVVSIGARAFSSCGALTEMIIPESVQVMGNELFSLCSNLVKVRLPSHTTAITTSMFYSCSLVSR